VTESRPFSNELPSFTLSERINPDPALMDIGLPGMNGIEATTGIVRHCPRTNVMILMYDTEIS
jgi:DNA-binding NarL/FixJ family response regulator